MSMISLHFSPTGGTKQAALALAKGLGTVNQEVDLTALTLDDMTIGHDDVCIISVPSFGGRVPAIAMERLAQLKGHGAKTVLLVSYGNRAIEDTLIELYDGAIATGFTPVAGVVAVCEHSIMPQFATSRPNQADRAELMAFGKQIALQLNVDKASALEIPGNRPYRVFGGVPLKPKTSRACNHCGECAQNCPVGAILKSQPNQTDTTLCITCMRCVKRCPQQARSLNPLLLFLAGQKMKKSCNLYKENQLFPR
ncbi:4Fe-4S binding protein [Bengtsoniella intestinalis]|uniref:4Fe-4S binding protein n=1 Tax=Bengtsoniella intestinalis TaxID=3073143 RepID=UPI00391F0A9E